MQPGRAVPIRSGTRAAPCLPPPGSRSITAGWTQEFARDGIRLSLVARLARIQPCASRTSIIGRPTRFAKAATRLRSGRVPKARTWWSSDSRGCRSTNPSSPCPTPAFRASPTCEESVLHFRRRVNEKIDFWRASALQGYAQALQTVGLTLDDVTLVDLPVEEPFIRDVSASASGPAFRRPAVRALGTRRVVRADPGRGRCDLQLRRDRARAAGVSRSGHRRGHQSPQ